MESLFVLLYFKILSLWPTLFLFVGVTVAYYFQSRNNYSRSAKLLSRFPGPKKLPLIGNALEIRNPMNVLKAFKKWGTSYGHQFYISFGAGVECISLSSPPDLARVMTSKSLVDKSTIYDALRPWLGNGLFNSGGEKWRGRRKLLETAFHFQMLEQFQPVFHEKTKEFVDFIEEKIQDGESVLEVHSMFTKLTLDILCETAIGKNLNSLRSPSNTFLWANLRESQLLWRRITSPWLSMELLWKFSPTGREERATRKIVDDFANKVIQDRKKEFFNRKNNSRGPQTAADLGLAGSISDGDGLHFHSKKKVPLLDLLLEQQAKNDGEMSDEDIRGEVVSFMFAGHDTTSAGLTWALYMLGLHEEHQQRVCEELDQVFGDDAEREVTTTDLVKLKYLEMCIKESQRLIPVSPFIARLATQDFELENGLVIPKGANIILNMYLLHHSPDIYPDPLEYRPERFSAENCSKRHPFAFVPLSGGLRICIGHKYAYAETKTALANIFRKFVVKTIDPLMEDLEFVPELVTRPGKGVRIRFERRHGKA